MAGAPKRINEVKAQLYSYSSQERGVWQLKIQSSRKLVIHGNLMFRKLIEPYGQELPKIFAIMLNGKVHQRDPVASESTQTNNEMQQHKIRNTTTPMMIGVRFIFLVGVAATGAGLAGMLPAYSTTGGGGTGVSGRGTEGTAAEARGETTVAPASMEVTSKTSMICSPN